MIKRTVRTRAAGGAVRPAATAVEQKLRFKCPCGAALRVPISRANSHGRCPTCMSRLLLTALKDKQGRLVLKAIGLGESDRSGETFVIENPAGTAVKQPTVIKRPTVIRQPIVKAPLQKPASGRMPSRAPTPPSGSYRIEDHFSEIGEIPEKISFKCPCGRKLVARPANVDKRGRCPWCQTRLLLVGKVNPKSRRLEIHPLAVETRRSGDTMVIDG